MPVNFPFNSGITFPTALAAPVDEGMMFSYATARSLNTSKKVTKGLDAKIPLIVYNGAFVMDNQTEEILISNYFDNDVIDPVNTTTTSFPSTFIN